MLLAIKDYPKVPKAGTRAEHPVRCLHLQQLSLGLQLLPPNQRVDALMGKVKYLLYSIAIPKSLRLGDMQGILYVAFTHNIFQGKPITAAEPMWMC